MADYYTHFSAQLENLSDEEVDWVKSELAKREEQDENGWLGFDWELGPDKPVNLWLHSDESGNVESVASFVQAFLKKFRPNDKWGMEWSNDCSRPRLDAFGGGAVVVYAKNVSWLTTHNWLSRKLSPRKRK